MRAGPVRRRRCLCGGEAGRGRREVSQILCFCGSRRQRLFAVPLTRDIVTGSGSGHHQPAEPRHWRAAFALGLFNLFQKKREWKLSGPVVKVTTSWGHGTGGLEGDEYIVITTSNVGRASVAITGWGLELPDRRTLVAPNLPLNPPMPITLESGHEQSFYMYREASVASMLEGRHSANSADSSVRPPRY